MVLNFVINFAAGLLGPEFIISFGVGCDLLVIDGLSPISLNL